MHTAIVGQYPSKPLESWGKLVELRRKFVQDMWSAKDRGELLIIGTVGACSCIPIGLGEFHYMGGLGPNFGRIMEDRPLLVQCIETAETQGYGQDTCSTLRVTLGSMFLDEFDVNARTGQRVKADFALDEQVCQAQGKTNQLWGDYYHIPHFTVEVPPTQQQLEYLVAQLHECIEWMEKVTGRTYDDERLIEGVKNEWESRVLWARMCMLQKNIPAPIDQLMFFSFNTMTWRGGRHRKEVVDFFRMVVAEMEDRVSHGIAARPYERARLIHEGAATWYSSPVLRYPRRWGGTFIGSYQVFMGNGCFRVNDDYSLEVGPRMAELGIEPKNRDEALRALATCYLEYAPGVEGMYCLDHRVDVRGKLYQDWGADAVVFSHDRGCKGTSLAQSETSLLCKKLGIPTISYEGNVTNPNEFNEREYLARVEALMESLGLNRVEADVASPQDAEGGGGHAG